MILTDKIIKYYNLLTAKVTKGMALFNSETPYYIHSDPVISSYEALRKSWIGNTPIKTVCEIHSISRTSYYEMEQRFITYGFPGLLPIPRALQEEPALEELVLLIRKCRPSLSHIEILRITQAVPKTKEVTNLKLISKILNSYGYGFSALETDKEFWGRLQRTLSELKTITSKPFGWRKKQPRKKYFFVDDDYYHMKIEALRTLFFNHKEKVKDVCIRFNIPTTSFYRLVEDYRLYGPWAVITCPEYGKKKSISAGLQLKIILEKLEHPYSSAQKIVDIHKLSCSRFVVNRVIKQWELTDRNRVPVALDRHIETEEEFKGPKIFKAMKTAYSLLPERLILKNYRINRHFELICKKMKTHTYHICDPGPFILAPFVNELGIVQAFQTYGPPKLRGLEITNYALLNIFRIFAGYRRINHLTNDRDRSVALASGTGMFGSSSKYYEDTIEFKFEHIYKMKCDLVARAKELSLIQGIKLAFDFHFKEFYGKHAEERNIGKGPNKAKNMVPGFRPHVAWDLAANVIISIAYFQGGVRSTKIIKKFCEHNIYPVLDPKAVEEIYMDSEYTKEKDFQYFKETIFPNGEIYVCLKRNKQIDNIIKPFVEDNESWHLLKDNNEDEYKTIKVVLPRTRLPLTIVILRDRKTQESLRVFGTTNQSIDTENLLRKYRYRWIIENGLKDLVYSYFIDEVCGKDHERIDYQFYCVMAARLAYEYFLKELGGNYLNKEDGNKYTLGSMRNLLFEKRNCKIEQNASGDIILTFLDIKETEVFKAVSDMLKRLKEEGKNRVLWWNNRSILIKAECQY